MAPTLIRFGTFEVDLQTSEIRKAGVKIRLEGQPFQILKLLLQRPGQLVTREELKRQLWAGDTFVDFEVGINAAVKRLRQALDDSADVPRFVETLPRRGYRFICPIERSIGASDASSLPPPLEITNPPAPVTAADSSWRTQRGGVALVGILLAALVGSVYFNVAGIRDRIANVNRPPIRIAVMKIVNGFGGDENLAYLPIVIQEQLTERLDGLRAIEASPPTSVNSLYGKGEWSSPPNAFERLRVDYLVQGRIVKSGGGFRVSLSLFDKKQNGTIWNFPIDDRGAEGMFSLCADAAEQIANRLGVFPTPQEQAQLTRAKARSDQAAEMYLKGIAVENDNRQRIEYFKRAIDFDPNFAEPYQGIARAYFGLALQSEIPPLEASAQARAAIATALKLDPTMWQAHRSKAEILYEIDRDWEGAEREQAAARQLNPNAIGTNWLLYRGDFQPAIQGFQRSAARDPTSVQFAANFGWALAVGGDIKGAIDQLNKTLAMKPDNTMTNGHLALVLALNGQAELAIPHCDIALGKKSERQGVLGSCGWVNAVAGRREEARRKIDEIKSFKFVDPFNLALIYDGLGETDRAINLFQQASDGHSSKMFTLYASPMISAATRADGRFQELLDDMGMPYIGPRLEGFRPGAPR